MHLRRIYCYWEGNSFNSISLYIICIHNWLVSHVTCWVLKNIRALPIVWCRLLLSVQSRRRWRKKIMNSYTLDLLAFALSEFWVFVCLKYEVNYLFIDNWKANKATCDKKNFSEIFPPRLSADTKIAFNERKLITKTSEQIEFVIFWGNQIALKINRYWW